MKEFIKRFAKRNLGKFLYGRKSYAQEGEDLVVDRLLEEKRNGFYVEVGCHHPFRFSNTYLFYKKNWQGICIDPLPGTAALFKRWRPRDKVIEMGVSEAPSILTYYMFNEPALNTFDVDVARQRDGLKSYKIIGKKDIETDSLKSILQRQNVSREIDFLSVDVEGFDLAVLKSNDWVVYRPKIIIAECLTAEMSEIVADEVFLFLSMVGYKPYAKTGHSIVFKENKK